MITLAEDRPTQQEWLNEIYGKQKALEEEIAESIHFFEQDTGFRIGCIAYIDHPHAERIALLPKGNTSSVKVRLDVGVK